MMGPSMVIASNTVKEAMSRRLILLLILGAAILLVMAPLFSFLQAREEMTMIKSLGLGIIQVASMLICIFMGISLIPNEIERRTIYTVLSKPVQRYQFIFGKFLGGVLTVLLNVVVMGALFYAVLMMKGGMPAVANVWKGLLMIFLQMSVLACVAIFFSVFSTPFVNFFLTLAMYIIGLASTTTGGMMDPNKSMATRTIAWVMHYCIPQFGNFNIQSKVIHPETAIVNEAIVYLNNIFYAVIWIAVLLSIAHVIFDRREV